MSQNSIGAEIADPQVLMLKTELGIAHPFTHSVSCHPAATRSLLLSRNPIRVSSSFHHVAGIPRLRESKKHRTGTAAPHQTPKGKRAEEPPHKIVNKSHGAGPLGSNHTQRL